MNLIELRDKLITLERELQEAGIVSTDEIDVVIRKSYAWMDITEIYVDTDSTGGENNTPVTCIVIKSESYEV